MAKVVVKKFHSRAFVIDRAAGQYVTQHVEGNDVVSARFEGDVEKETTKKPASSADAEFKRMGALVFPNPVTVV